MKEILYRCLMIATTTVLVVLIVNTILYIALERRREKVARQFIEQGNLSAAYTRGFADGMNATLHHVTLVSNTVDIAPILEEMKP